MSKCYFIVNFCICRSVMKALLSMLIFLFFFFMLISFYSILLLLFLLHSPSSLLSLVFPSLLRIHIISYLYLVYYFVIFNVYVTNIFCILCLIDKVRIRKYRFETELHFHFCQKNILHPLIRPQLGSRQFHVN